MVLSVHGYGRDGMFTTLLLGGADRPLASHLAGHLRTALPGYTVADDLDIDPEAAGAACTPQPGRPIAGWRRADRAAACIRDLGGVGEIAVEDESGGIGGAELDKLVAPYVTHGLHAWLRSFWWGSARGVVVENLAARRVSLAGLLKVVGGRNNAVPGVHSSAKDSPCLSPCAR